MRVSNSLFPRLSWRCRRLSTRPPDGVKRDPMVKAGRVYLQDTRKVDIRRRTAAAAKEPACN